MVKPIRILITDDHAIVREGQRALIETEPGMDVVGEAADGIEAVQKARTLQPDVVLLDLQMPRMGGVEAIQEIKAYNAKAHILVLTSFAEDEKVYAAIKAGALGYLLKDSEPADLLQAIEQVHRGEPSLHPVIASKVLQEMQRPLRHPATPDPLTDRELQVLRLVAQGLGNKEIAERLVVTEATVRSHVSSILRKLGVESRTQAALFALRAGLVRVDELDLPLD